MRAASFVLFVLSTACATGADAGEPPKAQTVDGFWDHWGDGRAELNGYRVTTSRYGELRKGQTVLVFVTETFTDGQRVKSDGGHPDEYPVLKLNEARDFQTGVYDYHVMTSTFLRIDGSAPLGQPTKVSMGMQEWCGHVYEQLVPGEGGLDWTGHSYFDGEADRQQRLDLPGNGVLADALPVLARGLLGDLVAPGATVELPVLPTLVHGRFAHVQPAWTTGTFTRSTEVQTVQVPAGSFEVTTFTADVRGMASTTWYVEAASPHRLIKWTRADGEVAELLGSDRQPYWAQNRNGDEKHLDALGLSAP